MPDYKRDDSFEREIQEEFYTGRKQSGPKTWVIWAVIIVVALFALAICVALSN